MKCVVIESPFGGTPEEQQENLTYLRACMADCLRRLEAPYASHGLYTQPGVLDDNDPVERSQGMLAGFAWGELAAYRVVYTDRGISEGMKLGIEEARRLNQPVYYRSLITKEVKRGEVHKE